MPPKAPPRVCGALKVWTQSHHYLKILLNHQVLKRIICKLSYVDKNKIIV